MAPHAAWLSPLRIFQLIFAIIVVGIAAHLFHMLEGKWIHPFNDDGFQSTNHYVNTFKYIVFAASWTLVVTTFLLMTHILSPDTSLFHPYTAIVLEALSWVFWLAALACAAHRVRKGCNDRVNVAWFDHSVCPKMKTVLAFSVLEWFLFTATLAGAFATWSAVRLNRFNLGQTGPASGAPKTSKNPNNENASITV